jgi:pimeloyl-ACP methyl ester carboxylesterase
MDLNGLKVTHEGDSHFTLIGHSYGSTVVADAAWTVGTTGFAGADDVVLIGSPGTDMAKTAADFHLPAGGHVYVGSASTDPITQLGQIPSVPAPGTVATLGLGPDPSADNFGATRFRAEAPDRHHMERPQPLLRPRKRIRAQHGPDRLWTWRSTPQQRFNGTTPRRLHPRGSASTTGTP